MDITLYTHSVMKAVVKNVKIHFNYCMNMISSHSDTLVEEWRCEMCSLAHTKSSVKKWPLKHGQCLSANVYFSVLLMTLCIRFQ